LRKPLAINDEPVTSQYFAETFLPRKPSELMVNGGFVVFSDGSQPRQEYRLGRLALSNGKLYEPTDRFVSAPQFEFLHGELPYGLLVQHRAGSIGAGGSLLETIRVSMKQPNTGKELSVNRLVIDRVTEKSLSSLSSIIDGMHELEYTIERAELYVTDVQNEVIDNTQQIPMAPMAFATRGIARFDGEGIVGLKQAGFFDKLNLHNMMYWVTGNEEYRKTYDDLMAEREERKNRKRRTAVPT
jgi:hypothetical protein